MLEGAAAHDALTESGLNNGHYMTQKISNGLDVVWRVCRGTVIKYWASIAAGAVFVLSRAV